MPGENCLVCASDEGIFLDIVEQPTLQGKAKNCRLEKISEDGPSTKICHKCAFEIEQCNSFVEKVKKTNNIQTSKKGCCFLCFNTYNKDIFFDLSKEKIGVNNLIQRIRDLFPDELKYAEIQKQLICLSCRYCVDLLIDLRNLSDEIPTKLKTIIQNGIDPADLPKTRTSIVNRKTTFIQSSNLDLNTPSDTDSDSSSIMSNRKRINKVNKTLIHKSQRKCQQCKTEVKSGIDMYKIYRTGVTVCKQCWLTIDPGKTKTPSKKRKKIDYSETKLCSVLLEDVYQKNPYERIYKIEKDNKGNTVFIVTDDSENESKTKRKTNKTKRKINKTKSSEVENKQNEIKDSVHDIEIKKKGRPVKGNRKKDESDKNVQEVAEIKPTRSGSKRKESEQSIQGETEIKAIRNRRRKELEQNVHEEIEIKPNRYNRKRFESEESIKDEIEGKFPKNSEQTIQETVETKTAKTTRRRKESEESLQEDIEVRSTRNTRNRKDSEQSIQENIEIKSTRSTRWRKESEQSSQESESKSSRSNKIRRDSEHSSQGSIVILSSRELRRRKESEQSSQEDIEINVDVDSDSAPVFKKIKRSSAKVESMPKQTQSKISNENSAASDVSLTRKRGRSSSIDSTGSIRRSIRKTKKNLPELEEIIEIDDDSNSFKLQKNNISLNDDILVHESKRSRKDRIISCDEHSDTESNASDIKVVSKRSSSVSSKESSSVSKFKTPHNKDNQESINLDSLKLVKQELKSNKFEKIRKLEAGKSDDLESLKSIEVDTSESEEIDVLKSTDEETKDYSIEIESEDKENSILLGLDDSICKTVTDDDLRSDKEIDDEMNNSVDVDNLKPVEENVNLISNIFTKTQISKIKENTKLDTKETKELKDEKDSKLIKDVIESIKEKYPQRADNESIQENIVKFDVNDVKNVIISEIQNDIEKEIIVADLNDIEVNLSEDNSNNSMSEFMKERLTSSRRSLLNRNSKSFLSKKSKKNKSKSFTNDITVYDFLDSEITRNLEQTESTYTCTICDKIYENKFIGLQHELTHMKTLEIKLEKVEMPEKHKPFNESDIELEINSKEETFHSNLIEELITVDNTDEKSENNTDKQEKIPEKECNEMKPAFDKKEDIENDNEQNMKELSVKNVIVDSVQVNKDKETCNKLNEIHIEENIEEEKKENGEAIIIDSAEEKVESTEMKWEIELEITNRRSTRRLSKKVDAKNDRKSRGRRKSISDNAELLEITATIESESDKIAEAVQETLNDMAELHGKIQESSPVKVPEINKPIKTGEQEIENKIKTTGLKMDDEKKNDANITEKEECNDIESDVIQRVISKHKEAIKCENDNNIQEIENNLITPNLDIEDESPKQIIFVEKDQVNESAVKILRIDDSELEPIKSITDVDCQLINVTQNNECQLSTAENDVSELEEVVGVNANGHDNKNIVESITEINVESITETNMTMDKPSLENSDNNLSKADNIAVEMINDDDDNNTEDEEALAQESLEELLQRKGLQIIDELAESVTDGDEESEKDVNISSEKENVRNKDVELDNDLQIKISEAECTEILESSKCLSKQKEVEQSVVGESQIIQDVDVVEEVINDDDQPHGDVVQEVEVESNGNCVNVANNVVGQVLNEVFNMATVDLSKSLELQTEPISDEETEIIPETLENISREIRNSQDMPSLDPIGDAIDE